MPAEGGDHRRYTWVLNRRNGWQGHLWQNRYFSCPLDGEHLVNVVRYVELNPVRAKLASSAEAWRWSSAPARVAGKGDKLVSSTLPMELREIGNWSLFLAAGLAEDMMERIRHHQSTERPLGNDAFLKRLEASTGRRVLPRPRGRPRRDSHPAPAIPPSTQRGGATLV